MGAGRCSAEIGCSDERRDETNRRGLPRPRWAQRPAVRRVRGVKLPVHLVECHAPRTRPPREMGPCMCMSVEPCLIYIPMGSEGHREVEY